jgi:hypothetical protein
MVEHCLEIAVFSGDMAFVAFFTGLAVVVYVVGAVVVVALVLAANAPVDRKPAKATDAMSVTVFMGNPFRMMN